MVTIIQEVDMDQGMVGRGTGEDRGTEEGSEIINSTVIGIAM